MSGEVSVEQKSSYTAFLTKKIPCNPTFDAKKNSRNGKPFGSNCIKFYNTYKYFVYTANNYHLQTLQLARYIVVPLRWFFL